MELVVPADIRHIHTRDRNLITVDKQRQSSKEAEDGDDETHLGGAAHAQVQLLIDVGP